MGCAVVIPSPLSERELTPWQDVCLTVEQELDKPGACADLPEVKVVITKLPAATIGAYGVHIQDEDTIFVAPQDVINQLALAALAEHVPSVEEVIFHESIHYILHNRNKVSRCKSEEYARKWTAKRFGFEYNEKWRMSYGCVGALPHAPPV